MGNVLQRLTHLKGRVESLRREGDRAQGSLNSALARLKEEHGCETLEEAQVLLEKLQMKEAKIEKAFEKSLREFEEKWRDVL